MSSSLALAPEARVGGGQRTERHFMEFVVDGERLGQVLGPFLDYDVTDNYVPVLVTDWPTGIALEGRDPLLRRNCFAAA